MKIGLHLNEEVFRKTVDIVASIEKEAEIDEILINLINNKIFISDQLFLLLQKLADEYYISSNSNKIKIEKEIPENYKEELVKYLVEKVKKLSNKVFFSALDISKFFQCQRRFFLEKVVKSEQKKTRSSFEGEVFHKMAYLMINNYNKLPLEQLVPSVTERVIKEYQNKAKVEKEKLLNSASFLNQIFSKYKFKYIIPEPYFVSLQAGLIATPDILAISEKEIVPIDLKMGSLRVKEALRIQLLAEAVVIEKFFRKEVSSSMIISLLKRKVFKLNFSPQEKEKIFIIKKQIEKTLLKNIVPPMSNLPNFRKVVCPFCHVKEVCDTIEEVKKLIKLK
ncbi:MAG: PD-(D/E)XK nuclease family protein [Candidatus Aenigmatarchaeota archaeon]